MHTRPVHPLRAVKITLLIVVCSGVFSCNQGPSSTKRNQFANIESALRNLLVTQRVSIEKDAPFVYEIDTFAGGVNVLGKKSLVFGKWTVEIEESRAHAKIQRKFGEGQRFESEVVEVDLEIDGDSVTVSHWRAYRGWGKQTGDAVGSQEEEGAKSPTENAGPPEPK
jgi:hypothetical protein